MRTSSTSAQKPFGKYLLLEKLKDGGMAEIYLGRLAGAKEANPKIVIKILHTAYEGDERVADLFKEEAKLMTALVHPNIVTVFDFGRVENTIYTAMEYVDGVDAAELLDACRQNGIPIPAEAVLHIGICVAEALSHAYAAKDAAGEPLHVVHRDISPHNILLSLDGTVKLCDFGLAATRAPVSGQVETAQVSDAIKGKLRYLSPEQAQEGDVDHRSDLFSLGVVLYELLAGHHPIPSGAGVSVLRELAGGQGYPSLADAAPWIECDICDAVDSALQFDKMRRPKNAAVFRDALKACLRAHFSKSGKDTTAALAARVRGKVEAVAPAKELPKRSIALPFVSIVLILVVGVVLLFMQRDAPIEEMDNNAMTTAIPDETPDSKPTPQKTVLDKSDSAGPPASTALSVASAEMPNEVLAETSANESDAGDGNEIASSVDLPSPKKPRFGFVNINASPWADVVIDGVGYTTTPLLGVKLRAGRHKVELINRELNITRTRVFTVKADETVTVVVEMQGE